MKYDNSIALNAAVKSGIFIGDTVEISCHEDVEKRYHGSVGRVLHINDTLVTVEIQERSQVPVRTFVIKVPFYTLFVLKESEQFIDFRKYVIEKENLKIGSRVVYLQRDDDDIYHISYINEEGLIDIKNNFGDLHSDVEPYHLSLSDKIYISVNNEEYAVRFDEDGIYVGCTYIEKETVDKIYKKLNS